MAKTPGLMFIALLSFACRGPAAAAITWPWPEDSQQSVAEARGTSPYDVSRAGGLPTSSPSPAPTAACVTLNVPEASRQYSSVWDNNAIGTGHARSMLNSPVAWCSRHNSVGHWMQMDLGEVLTVSAVLTQGRKNWGQWVTRYEVAVSLDGVSFSDVGTFTGNTGNDNGIVAATFPSYEQARYVRIKPTDWRSHMCMRAGVTACQTAAPTASPTSLPTATPTASPTSLPTATPTASPTSLPTSSPSPAPTPSPASAKGDPHMVNMHGQRFDLYQTGVHVLIQVPWQAKPADSLLNVEAEARRLSGACADLYFQVVNITGSWTAESRGLQFFANIELDDGYWRHFGDIDLKVIRGHTGDGIPYLNVLVKHLGRVKLPVGGLLGEDDHTAAMTPPPDCGDIVDLHRTRPSRWSRGELRLPASPRFPWRPHDEDT